MDGYYTPYGYKGRVGDRYIEFSSADEYYEFCEGDNDDEKQ